MTPKQAPTTSQVIASRVRELRHRKQWSQQELAEKMNAHLSTWVRSTVAKIESQDRSVTVDELVSLGYVFGTSPVSLMVLSDGEQKVTPMVSISSGRIWQWMCGSINVGGHRPIRAQVDEFLARIDALDDSDIGRLYLDALPDFVAAAEARLPGVRNVVRLAGQLQMIAGGPDEQIDQIFGLAAQHLKSLEFEIGQLRARVDMLRSETDPPASQEGSRT